jgi:hypothetical protein
LRRIFFNFKYSHLKFTYIWLNFCIMLFNWFITNWFNCLVDNIYIIIRNIYAYTILFILNRIYKSILICFTFLLSEIRVCR